MAKPYGRTRRALLNKPGVLLAADQPGRDILGHVTGDAFSAPIAGGQSYVERSPAPALRELVSSVWVQQVGRDAVGTAASPQEALAAVQLHVHELAGAGEPSDPLVSKVVRGLMPWRAVDVTSLRASLHISETQLRRCCHTAVGLAPKVLHRMLRFQGFLALVQRAIAQGRAATGDGLGLLALRVGYADQSHLTRECVRLTGVSPRVFVAETQRACACGHDHSASFAPVLLAETATADVVAATVSQVRLWALLE